MHDVAHRHEAAQDLVAPGILQVDGEAALAPVAPDGGAGDGRTPLGGIVHLDHRGTEIGEGLGPVGAGHGHAEIDDAHAFEGMGKGAGPVGAGGRGAPGPGRLGPDLGGVGAGLGGAGSDPARGRRQPVHQPDLTKRAVMVVGDLRHAPVRPRPRVGQALLGAAHRLAGASGPGEQLDPLGARVAGEGRGRGRVALQLFGQLPVVGVTRAGSGPHRGFPQPYLRQLRRRRYGHSTPGGGRLDEVVVDRRPVVDPASVRTPEETLGVAAVEVGQAVPVDERVGDPLPRRHGTEQPTLEEGGLDALAPPRHLPGEEGGADRRGEEEGGADARPGQGQEDGAVTVPRLLGAVRHRGMRRGRPEARAVDPGDEGRLAAVGAPLVPVQAHPCRHQGVDGGATGVAVATAPIAGEDGPDPPSEGRRPTDRRRPHRPGGCRRPRPLEQRGPGGCAGHQASSGRGRRCACPGPTRAGRHTVRTSGPRPARRRSHPPRCRPAAWSPSPRRCRGKGRPRKCHPARPPFRRYR